MNEWTAHTHPPCMQRPHLNPLQTSPFADCGGRLPIWPDGTSAQHQPLPTAGAQRFPVTRPMAAPHGSPAAAKHHTLRGWQAPAIRSVQRHRSTGGARSMPAETSQATDPVMTLAASWEVCWKPTQRGRATAAQTSVRRFPSACTATARLPAAATGMTVETAGRAAGSCTAGEAQPSAQQTVTTGRDGPPAELS